MRNRSLFLLLAAALTLLALIFLAPTQTWVKALLGFQLPALWTVLAMVGIFRSTRGEQPVAAALYATLGVTLANFLYFAMVFTGGHTG